MKKKKNRWTGVDNETRRNYIVRRKKLSFAKWCEVVQARNEMVRNKKNKPIPKKLKNLPILPENQAVRETRVGFIKKSKRWAKELVTPSKPLNVRQQEK